MQALKGRSIDVEMPTSPNFEDIRVAPDTGRIQVGSAVPQVGEPGTFAGYRRPGGRGVGTRNHAVVLALTESMNALATLESAPP